MSSNSESPKRLTDAQISEVFFFDTPDLALNAHGVVARARWTQGQPDDSDLSGQQQTKTKTALEYVAAGLMHAEKADAG